MGSTLERNHIPKKICLRDEHNRLMTDIFFKLKIQCKRAKDEGFHHKLPFIKVKGNHALNTRYIDKQFALHIDSGMMGRPEHVWCLAHLKEDILRMMELRRKIPQYDHVYLFVHMKHGQMVENQNSLYRAYKAFRQT